MILPSSNKKKVVVLLCIHHINLLAISIYKTFIDVPFDYQVVWFWFLSISQSGDILKKVLSLCVLLRVSTLFV